MVGAPKGPDGRRARWDMHNQVRRQVILDAALEVVEAGEPGAEFHVQQIAERAGLGRTVVYRHFADRADLDQAIQAAILEDLTSRLLPQVSLDGTVHEIIQRIVSTYVTWVVAHPALHRFAEQKTSGPMEHGIQQIAGVLVEILETAVEMLDVELGPDERAALDPLAHGLVGAVLGAVRRWISRDERQPSARTLSALLSESVWHILDGHARRLGLEIDPDLPIEQLLGLPDPEAVGSP